MGEETNPNTQRPEKIKIVKEGGGGMVYVLGVIGAAVYYIQGAASFSEGFVGFLKALVWPAFLIYYLLQFLQV